MILLKENVLGRGGNTYMVESMMDLPNIPADEIKFIDVETTAFDDDLSAVDPWRGDRICGIAVTWGTHPHAYYIPVRHNRGSDWNLPEVMVQDWLETTLKSGKWVNHNIKFDYHFILHEGVYIGTELHDTLTLAKILDSDRGVYGLKPLCRELCGLPMEEEHEIRDYLKAYGTKDFAKIPPDILGRYACMDVIGNRILYEHIVKEMPEQCVPVCKTEIMMTRLLADMEERGVRVDPQVVAEERVRSLHKQILYGGKLENLLGCEFTNSSAWMYDTFVNKLGLPIIAYNEKTQRPTFNKLALKMYQSHPKVIEDPKLRELIELITILRTEGQFYGLFLEPFSVLADRDGFIHPVYNQIVRTGRMSCSHPNIQQQNKRSKKLLLTRPGRCFISCDYSQIEFRLIAHYSRDPEVIAAYLENADTDFHTLAASFIYGVPLADVKKSQRSKGKTMNFAIGYGAGKPKVKKNLAGDQDIIDQARKTVELMNLTSESERHEALQICIEDLGSEIYENYHLRMPGIKRTSKEAARLCRMRGYVFNAYGRRRHLPTRLAHKAFNSVVQGCAMDVIKDRMIAASSLWNEELSKLDIHVQINVHDEIVFDAPQEAMLDPKVHKVLTTILEAPSVEFRVPIRVGLGVSATDWAEAAGDLSVKDADGNIIAGKII